MIKKLLVFFLIISMVGNCCMQLIMYSGYQLNKAYITSVFCVNKVHPELHCNGKCFLSKKLKELNQKTKTNQENLKKSVEGFVTFKIISVEQAFSTLLAKPSTGYLKKPTIGLSAIIFHPPKVA
ncbi:hypothetical protein ABIB40_002552 [Pedobacter sp. UYP30]|uniref:hypothetical protein n=1 Tax=Pedobacter sp. UYP30 TaxID=1756400 RepID=UPI003398B879